MSEGFSGSWVLRNGIRRPVIQEDDPRKTCQVCGSVSVAPVCRPCRDSARERVHGSHAGFNQHQRRFEDPCQACSDAEKVYQGARGHMSGTNRAWAEKDAIRHSWVLDTRRNRASVANTPT